MKRIYKNWIIRNKFRNKHPNKELDKDLTVQVDDIQWDQGDLGSWHKQQAINHSSSKGHLTTDSNSCPVLAKDNHETPLNDEILNEWDSQYDFCVKETPNSSPVRSKSQRSSKNKVKEVIVKGKDFVRSKVNSCRERFARHSMKETKKRSSDQTKEDSFGGEKHGECQSIGIEKKGHYSDSARGDNGVSTDLEGMTTEKAFPSEDSYVQPAIWSDQNGHSHYENTDYMVLPEVYTRYSGEDYDLNTEPNENTDLGNECDGERKTKGGSHQVEIVVVDEGSPQEKKERRNGVIDNQRDLEDAIPLGSEAHCFEKSAGIESSQLEVPVDKRLKWLLGNLDQHSFNSDFSQNTATSNSSEISVDMLLQERSDDPEEILVNLGFAEGEQADNPIERIPERFIIDKSTDGVSITDVLSDNPEISQFIQAISQEGADNLDLQQANLDAMMAGQGNPHYGNMLNSVMHGMKFLNLLNSAKSLSNRSDEHPSILQNPKNREYLAKQGFYDRHQNKKGDKNFKPNKLVKSQSLDASEKRKRFQATKSRNYSSLTNVPEQDEVFDSRRADGGNQSFGTSFGTGRTCSFDNRRSVTSIETSTDSYDSGDSPGYGRHGGQELYTDSGIWNTEDSQRSLDEEYLSEYSRDTANQRQSLVNRMMSSDHYNVGDDADILKSPTLSRTGSLENTLTASGFHKLETKSSTLKGPDSFDDDIEFYSEKYIVDGKDRNGRESIDEFDSRRQNGCLIKPENASRLEEVSGWKRFQKRYGVEMSVRVEGNKTEADISNNNYENCEIPMESQGGQSMDRKEKPGLGSIGKIESVQSDSSGFAETDPGMPEPQVIQKVSSLGSSTESDQTFKSSITILPKDTPKMSITSPDGTRSISLDISGSEEPCNDKLSRIDVAVGTEDFSEYLHTPSVSYHLSERDQEDSGAYSDGDKSVILTIELPKHWVNTNPNKKIGKPRVVSHLYKEIGPRSSSVDLDSLDKHSKSDVHHHRNHSNYPLIRTASDGSVPMDRLSSTPYGHQPTNLKVALQEVESSSRNNLFANQFHPHSSSPSSLSIYSDMTMHGRTFSDIDHYNTGSEYSLNLSSASLVSKTESVSNLCNNSLEYYKLMKLVNQPLSFKSDSTGAKSIDRFVPKFSIKKWTQLKRKQQLEEETKLVQHTLQKYKAELNMMESHFLLKTQLVKEDLSFGDREDVQELQLLWVEVRKEVMLMEETLNNRLSGINMGNDNYNPMLALDIVRKMTDLLREQIYQQQMTNEREEESMETNPSDAWWPSTSKELLSKPRSTTDLQSELSSGTTLSELKESILTEVRQELHDNTQWLHRELEKKEKELNALKLQLMSSSIKAGTTRKKHFFESDV